MRRPTRTPRPVTREHVSMITSAILKLKAAREILRRAGAKASADYVAACIKSAQGAERHAERVLSQRASPPNPLTPGYTYADPRGGHPYE